MIKVIFSFILSLAVSAHGLAQLQTNKFRQINTIDGLSSSIVNSTFKDSRGFLWMGTVDGLNRYDGYTIEIFKNDPNDSSSISGNVISSINELTDGRLIIGTRFSGINIFNPINEEFLRVDPTDQGIPPGSITCIEVLDEKGILVGSQGGGLLLLDPLQLTITTWRHNAERKGSISSDLVLSIEKINDQLFWVGTNSGGVDLFNLRSRTFNHYVYDPSYNLDLSNRKPLLVDRAKNLWVGTDGQGLVKLNNKSQRFEKFTTESSDLSASIIASLYEGSDGLIYVGTDGQGIDIIDPRDNSFTNIRNSIIDDHSLSSDAVYDMYEDDGGNIFVSTFRGGVNIHSPKMSRFNHYQKVYMEDNSLSLNSVISIISDSKGSIWIGTDGGGLDYFDPITRNFKHFTYDSSSPNSLSSNVITAVQEDADGNIWAGTYAAGLNKLDPSTNNVTRYISDPNNPRSLGSRNIWDLLIDNERIMWLGLLDGGLDKYDPTTDQFTHFRHDPNDINSISSNLVLTMMEDNNSGLWIGTEDQGLNLFNKRTETFQRFTTSADGLQSKNIRTFCLSPNGNLWVGTGAGISMVDTKSLKITHPALNQQLPNLVISGIRFDNSGKVWISHGRGISRFDIQNNSIDNYSLEDGLQGIDFNYDADANSSLTGEFFFAGSNGFNVFDPLKIKKSDFQPHIVFTDIKLNGLSLQSYSTKKENINYWESLELSHEQNALTFEYAALDFSSVSSISYKYMLDGFDQDWKVPTNQRKVSYTNLDPGNYQLRIMATNADGVWSEKIKSININISPAWWNSWWFRLFAGAAIIASLVTFYKWRVNMIKSQRKMLQEEVKIATQQVQSQNEALKLEQENLREAIEETNEVVGQAVSSGNFSARIDTSQKSGAWLDLGNSINALFDSIMQPFKSLNLIINKMSQKDLTIRYSQDAKGEVAELTDNLNHALTTLADLLGEIQIQSSTIVDGSKTMELSAQEMNLNTAEISSSISEMAMGAGSQVEKIDESSKLLEQILYLSGDISKQANSIFQVANTGVDQSARGTDTIQRMDQMMQEIKGISAQTNDSMRLLISQSREISQIISMIKEISNETNLLSLNATIEAAKAGESGRGFAVIANQIRILSEDTTASSKQIEKSIQDIQQAIEKAESEINQMTRSIAKGENAASEAISSFEQLTHQSQESLDLSKEILGSSKSQNQSVQKVVSFMEGVVVISEQTAAGTEEIAASAQELSSGMEEFARNSQEVNTIIENLRSQIDQFKLDPEQA